MKTIVFGLFKDSSHASHAVDELKEKGYTQDISVMAKDEGTEKETIQNVKNDIRQGAGTGAVVGAATGAIGALLSGIAAIAIPGIGIIVGGPLVALLGLGGGAVGALTGGLIGALVDAGLPDNTAKLYDERIKQGEILIAVSADESKSSDIRSIFMKHESSDINELKTS